MNDDKKNQGIRLATIILDTYLYGEVDKYDLATRFNVSERTIYRDLGSLSLILEHKGGSKYGFSTVTDYYKMISFFGIDKYLPELNPVFFRNIQSTIENDSVSIQFNGVEHKIKTYLKKHYDKIRFSIENKRICNIFYKGKHRIISPYKLICHNTVWYLKATEDNKLKSFSLNRIEWLDVSKDVFSTNLKVQKILIDNNDPWVSSEKFNVLVSIKPSISHYFRRREILPSQSIINDNNDSLIISCTPMSEKQILPLIQYWLPNIEILEPMWLKKKLEATLKKYINKL